MVWVGTDTYGKVKTVAGTPIVTRFFTINLLPLYPLQSLYFFGEGKTEFHGVPLIAGSTKTEFRGIPLTKIDRASVAMAYVRGIFGGIFIVGAIGTLTGIMVRAGGPPAPGSKLMLAAFVGLLALGAIGGGLSYRWPLLSAREREVREFCAELLGIAIDPAHVVPEWSADLYECAEQNCQEPADSRQSLILELIAARGQMAQQSNTRKMDRRTTELLERLREI